MNFLKDLSQIPSDLASKPHSEEQNPEVIEFVRKKMKLIAALANLAHIIARDSTLIL